MPKVRMVIASRGFMNAEEIAESARSESSLPSGLNTLESCLWHARAGNWDESHDLCQEVPGADGAWMHAWLHRQEGDLGNAAYWYSVAGREMPSGSLSLEAEWMEIATALLS